MGWCEQAGAGVQECIVYKLPTVLLRFIIYWGSGCEPCKDTVTEWLR